MSPDDGMDLADLLIKPCLSWVCGGGDLMGRFLCGDVLSEFFHGSLGGPWKGNGGLKVCPRKG